MQVLQSMVCDDEDVLKAIRSLKSNTTSGPDGVSAVMLKACSKTLCGRLSCIFNSSFSSGKVPTAWKTSRVTPIYKKGDPSLVQNYRPISLLSLIGKLQERLVHQVLMTHLLQQNAISPSQFGFRPGSSTQEALVSMTQVWHKHLEAGLSTACVFLDLAKAFDSVPHHGVISALSAAGVTNPLLGWFSDYLSNRRQFVALDGSTSFTCKVTSGVPQGSILGPLLFILTFDGIFRLPLSPGSNLSGYADDATYSRSISGACDQSTVLEDLQMICHWLSSHGFRLNVTKVKAMIISRKKKPPTFSIDLQGEPLEFVDSFRLLGVTITSDLTWRHHISEITSKAKRLLGFLYRLFRDSNPHCLARLYKAIVLPHLDYCSCVWDPLHVTHIAKIERVQSFAARIVTNDWSRESQELKSELGWPSLAKRRLFQKLCVCRKIVSGNSIIPSDFFQTAPRKCASHKNSTPLYSPFVRTKHHKSSFKLSIISHWNQIPEEVASVASYPIFKRRLHAHLFGNP